MLLTGISDPSVENPVGLLDPHFLRVIKSSSQHLLAERHDVWRTGLKVDADQMTKKNSIVFPHQIEVLVRPHLAAGASPGLHLVDDVTDVILLADPLQTLRKIEQFT